MKGKHCERTSWGTTVAFVATIWIAVLVYYNQWQYSINYFYLVTSAFVFGWLAVVWYRTKNHKPILSKETLFFWSAKP